MLANELLSRNVTNDAISASANIAEQNFSTRTGVGEIESRFGKISINYDEKIFIEKGLLGITDKLYFCILPFPVQKFSQFRLLQSLEETSLSLITYPLSLQNEIVEAQDLTDAMRDLNMNAQNCDIFLVVNIYREMSNVRMSVNARAPIFVDKATKRGEQMVLRNQKYMVRHMIKNELSKPSLT